MLAIAGPGREASEKSNLSFTEAALPFAGCQCLCLPAGPTKHQALSLLSNALSSGLCTSSSQVLQPLQVHQAIKTAPKPSLPSLTFWVQPRTRLGLLRLDQAWENTRWQTPIRRLSRQTRVQYLRSCTRKVSRHRQWDAWLASCCCFLLLPASCCFLPLAAPMTGQHL